MAFPYTPAFLDNALTYAAYRETTRDELTQPPKDEAAQKMRGHIERNARLMDEYDLTYKLSSSLRDALEHSIPATWVVITEPWCGDAAFNVPMFAAIECAFPRKVKLALFLRDSNPELIDANLTDGGRSIPKLIVLNENLEEVGSWGPRPAGLQEKTKAWKNKGLPIRELIPLVQAWYDADGTKSVQQELERVINSYSVEGPAS